MNIERILAKVRELETVIEEETCIQNPIESVGLRAEFYDIFMTHYLMKIGPFVNYSDIYRARINGIEYIPVFPEEKPESNTKFPDVSVESTHEFPPDQILGFPPKKQENPEE